jgi:hypothetical protein
LEALKNYETVVWFRRAEARRDAIAVGVVGRVRRDKL